MAQDDRSDDGPSLEMPSLSLRRRRRREVDEEAPSAGPPEPTATLPPEPAAYDDSATPPVPEHVPESRPRAGRRGRRARAPRQLPRLRTPTLPGVTAAVVTGVVVGLLAVVLTWGTLRGCELVRGTSSCGGGPGLLLLVAVLGLLTYAGSWLLRALGVRDAGSTSFLGAGLMAVLAMLFLAGSLFEWWMVVAIPLVAAATYALAWWVTTRAVERD